MQEQNRFGSPAPWLAAALAIALLPACGDTRQPPADAEEPPARDVEAADVKEELQEAAATLKTYTFEQKQEFEEWGNGQLVELDEQLAELGERSQELGAEARQELDETLANLKSERRALDVKLDAALAATSESWSELQSGFVEAREVLGEAIRRAADELDTDTAVEAPRDDRR